MGKISALKQKPGWRATSQGKGTELLLSVARGRGVRERFPGRKGIKKYSRTQEKKKPKPAGWSRRFSRGPARITEPSGKQKKKNEVIRSWKSSEKGGGKENTG